MMACQWCKDLMGWGLAQGFAWSIGLLLTVPVLLVAAITVLVVRAARRGPRGAPAPRQGSGPGW